MEFQPKQIDRRTFLRLASAAGITIIGSTLPGCSEEYIREQKDPDGKATKLILPNGESNVETGSYSLILPEGYLSKIPLTMVTVTSGAPFVASLSIEIQNPVVKLSGSLNIPSNRIYEEWRVSGPAGDLKQRHVYQVQWEKQGIRQLLWDENVINPPKQPSSPTI